MFQPTEVENYPDGQGPMRGAQYSRSASAASTNSSATRMAWRSASPAFCAQPPAPPTASTSKPRRTLQRNRISSAERYAKVYNIDYNRCIFCGYCVEACPTDAITHGHGFELATLNATTLVMRKEDLAGANAGHARRRLVG